MQTDIKNIPIANILASRYNLQPTRHNGNRLTYLASWRGDHKPSLAVFTDTNRWHDFGSGKHGSNIDLIMEIEGCNYGQAADMLKDMEGIEPITFSSLPGVSSTEKSSTIEVIKDEFITDPADPCYRYLVRRGLTDPDMWGWRIKKVTYRNAGKEFWGIGWQDEQKHWHIRNLKFGEKAFKCCSGQGVTYFSNEDAPGYEDVEQAIINNTPIPTMSRLIVLEGIVDYYSLLTMFPEYAKYNAVILNSLANSDRKIANTPEYGLITWQFEDYKEICLLLDWDKAGNKAIAELMAFIPKSGRRPKITDCRGWYAGSNDVNEHLQKKLGLWRQ